MSELGTQPKAIGLHAAEYKELPGGMGEFYNFLLKSAGKTVGHSAAAQKDSSLAFDFQIKYRETGRSHKKKRIGGAF